VKRVFNTEQQEAVPPRHRAAGRLIIDRKVRIMDVRREVQQ